MDRGTRAFTLVELLLVMAILACLAGIGFPIYNRAVNNARNLKAIMTIKEISATIDRYFIANNEYPTSLEEVGHGGRLDPWGHPYVYLRLQESLEESESPGKSGKKPSGKDGKARKDKNLVPINKDYDLYSMGPDGRSVAPLTAEASHDDIVRANDGSFIDVATKY